MKDYRKYALWYGVGCLILPQISYAMTCEEAPDCTALGFKVAGSEVNNICKNKTRMKCPFGDYYFCSETLCNGYPFNQTCSSGDICGEACTDENGTHYRGTSCDSTYKYEEVGVYHNIGADLSNRSEHCSFLKGSRCFENGFVYSVVGKDCVACSEKGYPLHFDINVYDIKNSSTGWNDSDVCLDKSGQWFKADDDRISCKTSLYPYTSANCNYNLGGNTCTDAQGIHYSSCSNPCSGYEQPYYDIDLCSSYSTCTSNGETFYRCNGCKGTCMTLTYQKRCYSSDDTYYPNRVPNHATSYTTCTDSSGVTRYIINACEDGYKVCPTYCQSPTEGGYCQD